MVDHPISNLLDGLELSQHLLMAKLLQWPWTAKSDLPLEQLVTCLVLGCCNENMYTTRGYS